VDDDDRGADADALAVAHVSLVYAIARRIRRGLPAQVDIDDLVAAGHVGLVEAAARFDPSKGVLFRTFAGYRIHGAIVDSLRDHDPLSRKERAAARASGEPAYDEQLRDVHLRTAASVSPDHDERITSDQQQALLATWVGELPPRSRFVLERCASGALHAEIATDLGIGESRVSQIAASAIKQLQGRAATMNTAAATNQPAPIGDRCALCGCRLETPINIERGLCGSCVTRPEAKRLARNESGRALPPVRLQAVPPPAPERPVFTPAAKAIIKNMHAYLPAVDLLRLLNERVKADRGPRGVLFTLEDLHEEIRRIAEPEPAADWTGLRQMLARARSSGLLAMITMQTVEDFATVFQLSPGQLLHLKDVVQHAKEDR
jgi:RNA polymerase sigma factor (sigma-70 family)